MKIPQDLRGNPLERAGFLPYAYPAINAEQAVAIQRHLQALVTMGGLQDRIWVRRYLLTNIVSADWVES